MTPHAPQAVNADSHPYIVFSHPPVSRAFTLPPLSADLPLRQRFSMSPAHDSPSPFARLPFFFPNKGRLPPLLVRFLSLLEGPGEFLFTTWVLPFGHLLPCPRRDLVIAVLAFFSLPLTTRFVLPPFEETLGTLFFSAPRMAPFILSASLFLFSFPI